MEYQTLLKEWNKLKSTYHRLEAYSLILTGGKKTAGYCNKSDKVIAISRFHLANSPDFEVMDTLKHEIAHALSYSHGHGKEWRECCKVVGAKPERCLKARIAEPNYFISCANGCFNPIGIYRVSGKLKRSVCVKCKQKPNINKV